MSKTHSIKSALPTMPETIEALADIESFSGSDLLAQAGRIAMAKHMRKLYHHLPGVISGDDPHDLHQARVATRRLRASLEATAPAYRPRLIKDLRKSLRRLAKALGEVRDRDVLLMRLHKDMERRVSTQDGELHTVIERIETDEERDQMAAVIDRIEAERDAARADLLKELGRKRTMHLLNDLNDFFTEPLEDVQAGDDGLPLLVHHVAGTAIWREYERVRRFETVMPRASSERLHRLRIACKHLRYTLELFEPALGEGAQDWIKQVEAMQEHLGDLHDTDVALSYFGVTHADTGDGAGTASPESAADDRHDHGDIRQYVDERAASRTTLLAEVEPLWNQLSSDTSRHALANLIAAM